VAVDEHQRAALVEERRGERNAELDRRDGEAAPRVKMFGVEGADRGSPPLEIARLDELGPDPLEPLSVFDRLTVVRGVAVAIKVAPPDDVGWQRELLCGARQNLFDDE